MSLESVDPATGERIARYEEADDAEVASLVEAAHEAFLAWRDVPLGGRATLLRRAAAVLRDGRESHAERMAREMGKPLAAGRAEVDKCARACEHYAEHGPGLLADRPVPTEARESFVTFQPLGVVLAVMPWNFPYWQVFRFAAPALLAGNAALLKHASNVTGCSLAIEEVFVEAGFPSGLFRSLRIGSARVESVIRHPRVAAATLTGSTEAGRAVAAAAGREVKPTVLELGGSDPYLVLADADLERAAESCAASRLINAGQSCIAAKRFLVVEAVADEFERRFVERMAARRVGHPLDEATEVGPLARPDLRDAVHRQVRGSVEQGARVLLGGELPDGPGAFYPPTVLTSVRPGMSAWDEEVFGPVAAVLRVRDEDEAVRLANDSPFGLGAAVFTRDRDRGRDIARRRLDAGCCFVNAYVQSDPRLPFGGIKASGYGRELGELGLREFVNAKTVWVE